MRFAPNLTSLAVPVLALGMMAVTGCNQTGQDNDKDTAVQAPAGGNPDGKAGVLGEGRKLEGAELDAFLKRVESQIEKPLLHEEAGAAVALPKAAATSCLVDFNSASALMAMTDHAYAYYATYPWYTQPCANLYGATVLPVNYNSYYLPSEVPTCSQQPYYMGTPAAYPCKNTKDAAYFPRHAANATISTKDLGLQIYMHRNRVSKNFDLNGIRVIDGTITLYAFRRDINGWWYWNLTPGSWYFPWNSTNLREIQIFAINKNGTYTVDDIQLTGRD